MGIYKVYGINKCIYKAYVLIKTSVFFLLTCERTLSVLTITISLTEKNTFNSTSDQLELPLRKAQTPASTTQFGVLQTMKSHFKILRTSTTASHLLEINQTEEEEPLYLQRILSRNTKPVERNLPNQPASMFQNQKTDTADTSHQAAQQTAAAERPGPPQGSASEKVTALPHTCSHSFLGMTDF